MEMSCSEVNVNYIREAFLISFLWIFHTSLSLYLYITMYSRALCNILRRIFGGKTNFQRLEDLCAQLTKIPEHISFLMLENSVTEKSMAKLVVWSLVLGIQNISLYDHKGRIKQNQDTLLLEIHHLFKKMKLDRQIQVTWQPGANLSNSQSNIDKIFILTKDGAVHIVDINGNGKISSNGQINGTSINGFKLGAITNGVSNVHKNGKNCYSNGAINGTNGVTNGMNSYMNGTKNGTNGVANRKNGHNGVHHNINGSAMSNGSDLLAANGSCQQLNIRVALLSADDGKPQIARCAQVFSKNITRGSLKINDINECLVDDSLGLRHYPFDSLDLQDTSEAGSLDLHDTSEAGSLVKRMADPSLLVRIGNLNSNYEYPPWELRLTEIHCIDPSAGIYIDQFTEVLRRFSKCEQRYGK